MYSYLLTTNVSKYGRSKSSRPAGSITPYVQIPKSFLEMNQYHPTMDYWIIGLLDYWIIGLFDHLQIIQHK